MRNPGKLKIESFSRKNSPSLSISSDIMNKPFS